MLMALGMLGMIGYMGYFAKQETKAIIGDGVLQPKGSIQEDNWLINQNFKLICRRCDVKLDWDGNPVHENHYKVCMAYLLYQGFQEPVAEYFKEIYLEKYHKKHEDKREEIRKKHWDIDIDMSFIDKNEYKTKIFRKWHWKSERDTKEDCEKMCLNYLWSCLAKRYNVVNDGNSYVVVWTVEAPPSILNQINTIYDEVRYLEGL